MKGKIKREVELRIFSYHDSSTSLSVTSRSLRSCIVLFISSNFRCVSAKACNTFRQVSAVSDNCSSRLFSKSPTSVAFKTLNDNASSSALLSVSVEVAVSCWFFNSFNASTDLFKSVRSSLILNIS